MDGTDDTRRNYFQKKNTDNGSKGMILRLLYEEQKVQEIFIFVIFGTKGGGGGVVTTVLFRNLHIIDHPLLPANDHEPALILTIAPPSCCFEYDGGQEKIQL